LATSAGLKAAGEVPSVPSAPSTPAGLVRSLPTPAPEMLRALAAQGERYRTPTSSRARSAKSPSSGHRNSGIAVLRNNDLIETDGRRYRAAVLFRK
jgi:hypothetical protein